MNMYKILLQDRLQPNSILSSVGIPCGPQSWQDFCQSATSGRADWPQAQMCRQWDWITVEIGLGWHGVDFNGTGSCQIRYPCARSDTPLAILQIFGSKRAGVDLSSPIGDQAVARGVK